MPAMINGAPRALQIYVVGALTLGLLATLLAPSPRSAGAMALTPPVESTLLASGQTTPYEGNSGVVKEGNADDGDLIRGRPQRYQNVGNNLVLDKNTGLMWLADPGAVFGGTYPWSAALNAATDLTFGGFDDWRMPNLKELQTLVDYSRSEPSLNSEYFPRPFDQYPTNYGWTSTTSPTDAGAAMYVNFLNGHTYPFDKAVSLGLFPVRTAELPAGTAPTIALLTTGQTVSYEPGDDGATQRGVIPNYTLSSDARIDTQAENLATDTATGLMWIRDPFVVRGNNNVGVSGNVDLTGAQDWQSAIDAANALDYGGFTNWRMPNIVELESLSRTGSAAGLHQPGVFTNAPVDVADPDRYVWWSSTTAAFDRSPAEPGNQAAWYVGTALGSTNFLAYNVSPAKARLGFVRPVRDIAPGPSRANGLAEIRSTVDFDAVTIASPRADIFREGKFVVPTQAHALDAPFAAAFQNVSTYPLHLDFLLNEYPADFAGLTEDQYLGISGTRASRQFWVGGLRSFADVEGMVVYGFDVAYDRGDVAEVPTQAEITELFEALTSSFRRRPLVYSPRDDAAIAAASQWTTTAFEVAYPVDAADPDYEPYTTGRAYGTVRVFTLAELLDAGESGGLSSQDIVVVDGAPSDLASVVAAIVTGERQSALAHLTIRTARRGTPNAYVADATTTLAQYEGQLVRLDATGADLTITPGVTIEDAQAWWESIRPDPIQPAAPDDVSSSLDELSDIGFDPTGIGRIGGKAANLASLFTVLPDQYEVDAFAIPFSKYVDFISSNTLLDTRQDPPVTRTYGAYIDSLHVDPEFMTNPTVRAQVLGELIDEMRANGVIDPTFLSAVSDRVDAVFGVGTKVRFRSSSNAEDALQFSGAGLYDSTSACVSDGSDGDSDGPSLCDPGQEKERTVERALKKVWASLWNFGAWEEREYFGMRHVDTRMGILVSTAFPDERANGVAFTGDPAGLADGYLINVQDGDTSVVFPESGVSPETNQLFITNGVVSSITRVRPSSLIAPGAVVMNDAELNQLGQVMAEVDASLPVDVGAFSRDDILLDFEFKLRREDDSLVFKQVRPFLKPSAESNEQAEVRIEVPTALELCSSWTEGLGWRTELGRQVIVELNAGETVVGLADGVGAQGHALFGDTMFGSPVGGASPAGSGTVDVQRDDLVVDVALTQTYTVANRRIELALRMLDLPSGQFSLATLDSVALQGATRITATIIDNATNDVIATVRMVPCSLDQLSEQRYTVTLADGSLISFTQLRERFDGVSGLAGLTRATVSIPGEPFLTVLRDPASLGYAADRHHWNEEFVALFPVPINGRAGVVFEIDSGAGGVTGYRASWLSPSGAETPVGVVAVDGRGVVTPEGPEVMVTVSCLAGNGRVDFNIVNVGGQSALYRVEFEGLTPRARTVAAGDWWRMPVTGRPEGSFNVVIKRAGVVVAAPLVVVACDQAEPAVTTTPVAVVNACRAGNGYLLFQFANPTDAAVPYVLSFDNVRNRSTTVAPYGQSVRAVTGRPDGTWNYTIKTGGTVVAEGAVLVDCDPG